MNDISVIRHNMGSRQSVRATHFQRPDTEVEPAPEPDEIPDEHQRISISNKMVERLVEDATLASGAATNAAITPKGDYKDKMFMEKLKSLDENHTERLGLTVEEVNAIATRVELRTANMVGVEPVCADCKQRVIECYNSTELPGDFVKCWDTVGAFTKCVQDAASARLRARTQKEARDYARRSRHVAHAREHALRDLGPPPTTEDTPA